MIIGNINSDECVKYRLECLKMSYEFNIKIGNIKSEYTNENEIFADLIDIFSLADMYMEFLIHGKIPDYVNNKYNSNISKIEEETKK